MAQASSEITDARPYVVVRWTPDAVHKTYPVGRRHDLHIPREFEAAIVASDIRVNLKLQATEWLREIKGGGLPVPDQRIWLDPDGRFVTEDGSPYHPPDDPKVEVLPEVKDPVIVKSVSVTTDVFSLVSAARFKRIPLKTYVRFAVAAAATPRHELRQHPEDESPGGSGGTMDEWTKKVFFDDVARHPVGRPSHKDSDCFYSNFGNLIYWQDVLNVAAQGEPRSTKALMEHFDIPRKTAQRWKKDAAEWAKLSCDA